MSDLLRQLAAMGMDPVGGSLAGQVGPGPGALLDRPGIRDALIQGGLAAMAASARPGATLASSVGQGALAGLPAYQRGREEAAVEDFMDNAPDSFKRLMAINPNLAMALAPPPQPVQVSSGAVLVDPRSGETLVDNRVSQAPKLQDLGDRWHQIAAEVTDNRTSYREQMTAEEIAETNRRVQGDLERQRAAGVAQPEDKWLSTLVPMAAQEYQASTDRARTAQAALDRLAMVREDINALGAEPFRGRFADIQVEMDRFASAFGVSDGRRAAATQIMDLFYKTNALDIIQAFPGQLSNKELEAAQFLAGQATLEETTLDSVAEAFEYANNALITIASKQGQILNDSARRGDVGALLEVFSVGYGAPLSQREEGSFSSIWER